MLRFENWFDQFWEVVNPIFRGFKTGLIIGGAYSQRQSLRTKAYSQRQSLRTKAYSQRLSLRTKVYSQRPQILKGGAIYTR